MEHKTPIRAIRAHCLDCSNGSAHEVRRCPCVKCNLYAYRFGIRPETHEKREKAKDDLRTEK